MSDLGNTQFFRVPQEQKLGVEEILEKVYEALAEKGYNPVNQIVGYIMLLIILISVIVPIIQYF